MLGLWWGQVIKPLSELLAFCESNPPVTTSKKLSCENFVFSPLLYTHAIEQTVEFPVIWNVITLMRYHGYDIYHWWQLSVPEANGF